MYPSSDSHYSADKQLLPLSSVPRLDMIIILMLRLLNKTRPSWADNENDKGNEDDNEMLERFNSSLWLTDLSL